MKVLGLELPPSPNLEELDIKYKLRSTDNSVLYLAHLNGDIDVPVVYKMPTPRGLTSLTNELRELSAAQDIDGVIPLLGYGEGTKGKNGSKPFLITPYIARGSLKDFLPPTSSEAVLEGWQVFRGVAATLDNLHKRKVTHRDVKPDNILRDEENRSYLIDFADASYRFRVPNGIKWGNVRGTMSYVSPERLIGSSFHLESDTYSLGVSIIEVLTGKHPWLDRRESATMLGPDRMFDRTYNEQPQIDEEKCAIVPPEIIEFALGCLDPHPCNRPPVNKALELV